MLNKLLFLFAFTFAIVFMASAQSRTELGFRLGDTQGSILALDFTIPFGELRMHNSINFTNNSYGITLMGNYFYKMTQKFYFYSGLGGETGLKSDVFILGVAAEIGVEYRFPKAPFSIGTDWRPSIGIVNRGNFSDGSFGFNFRYRFD
ncbi:MAG: hypothetical protein ACXITV_02830 [Luteibaculaceae bacterium]